MHCTGQTSTHARSFTSTHASVMMAIPDTIYLDRLWCVLGRRRDERRTVRRSLKLCDHEPEPERRREIIGSPVQTLRVDGAQDFQTCTTIRLLDQAPHLGAIVRQG
jgi:hypothetical protein